MRVCTDCHISLQTVTVATSLQAKSRGGGNSATTNGGDIGGSGGDHVFDDDDDETLLRRLGNGGDVYAEGGSAVGIGGTPGIDGWGFVERLEAVYKAGDIAGDLTLEDVLEWDRIQVRSDAGFETDEKQWLQLAWMQPFRVQPGVVK